jgi:Protein of unknown function (DUF3224)
MTYTHKATCRFDVASWSEKAYVDIDPGEGTTAGETYFPKRGLTEAEVVYSYAGEIEGSSTLRYVSAYKSHAAPVLGLEQFTGSVDEHEGSCVFMHIGGQDAGSVSAHVEVVPGMGTGGLEGLRGEAELKIAGHSDNGYELVLSYDLD